MTHIGLNAHLLSGQKGYRSAGIHGYIYHTLAHLVEAAPDDWRFTAMVGKGNPHRFAGIEPRFAPWNTEHPLRRIVWEQGVQPWSLSRYDLYHAMTFVSPLALTVPSVVTVYDLSFIHYPEVLSAARRLYLRLFTAHSCRRAERVIAISHSTARDLAATFDLPAEKIDVAACGYDTQAFRRLERDQVEQFRQQRGLPERFWLFVGTLEPRKNLPLLLDAYAALSPTERLPLILAGGKGWLYEPIFERIERYGLHDDVHLPGFIPAADLPLWYNCAEALLYPSVYEGFGLPVLEAMACGCPVVIAEASSLPEVAGDAGLHVPPRDVEAWRAVLARVFQDADWRLRARERGLLQAQRFNWRLTAAATIRSYQQALHLPAESSSGV